MVAKTQFMTATEFMSLPESPYPVELIDGVVIVSPTPIPRHQLIATRLVYRLIEIELAGGDGIWFSSPVDLLISQNSVFEPDAMLFDSERTPNLDQLPITEIPAIAVEILSPSSQSTDNIRKRAGYSDRGVAEYWIVDPQNHRIVFNIAGGDGTYTAHELDGATIPVGRYAGVELDLAWIFARS
jgi:Uma2 family endonuclease